MVLRFAACDELASGQPDPQKPWRVRHHAAFRLLWPVSVIIREQVMADHTYRVIELAGSSEISHADAIENAIARASKTTRNLRWFEVIQMRGEIENGEVRHYQVAMKVGFTLEE
jgi:flavin-binding protein dodecin